MIANVIYSQENIQINQLQNNPNFFFANLIILSYKTWNVSSDNIVISKLVETKCNLHWIFKPLDLILPKTSGYVNTFKVKNKNNKFLCLRINYGKLLKLFGI